MGKRPMIRYEETPYGFNWGAAEIERCFSDKKKGWVMLTLKTKKGEMQIYVTKTGKVKISDIKGKWTSSSNKK
jgi:hypothetical protein